MAEKDSLNWGFLYSLFNSTTFFINFLIIVIFLSDRFHFFMINFIMIQKMNKKTQVMKDQ